MRADMKYVVIERGRRGGHGKHNYTRPRRTGEEWEGYLKHEGMRLSYGWDTKMQTDVLNPLRGYLRTQVGRPWDLVYADICRHLDFRSVLGFHIKSHLFGRFGAVERHVEMRDGVPYERIGSYGPPGPVDGLYVHPRTGLLMDTRRKRKRRPTGAPAPPPWRVIVDRWTQLHWMHGAWFEITLAPCGHDVPPADAVMRDANDPRTEFARRYGRWGVYAIRKRQLSKKEKKQYGL